MKSLHTIKTLNNHIVTPPPTHKPRLAYGGRAMIAIALTPLKTLLKAVARTARNQTARLGTGWHLQALLDAARKQASPSMRCIGKPFAGLVVLLDSCLRRNDEGRRNDKSWVFAQPLSQVKTKRRTGGFCAASFTGITGHGKKPSGTLSAPLSRFLAATLFALLFIAQPSNAQTPAEPINQILTQSANEILLVFSGDATLDEVSGADFTVSGAASNPTVSSVGRFNDVTTLLLLTLSADIVESETITLAYTKGTGSITVTGQNTPLASFTNKAVTNLVEPDTRAPVAVSAETNTTGDSIVLTFNEAININDAVAADFTVTAGKRARTIAVTTLTANEKTLTLELTSAIAQGETVLLEYATKDTGIADAAGNVFGKDRRQVTNKVSVSNQPPTGHLSISMLLDGNTVTATRPLPEDQTTLSATPTVGDTLTAVTRGISDADGPETLSFSYQWQAGGDDIAAATAETFTLTNAQLGKQIKVIVHYTDTANRVETLASAQTNQVKEANAAPTANADDGAITGASAVSSPSVAFSPSGASDDSIAQAQQNPAEPINQILTQSANEILLVFSGDATLDEVSGADFSVAGAASNPTVSSVGRLNDVTTLLLLTLSADIVESETITLAYTKGTGSITVTGQNTPLASFTNKAVTNLVQPDTRAPVVASAKTNTTGDSIALTFNEAININDAVAADFTVTAGKRARTIAVTTLTANEKTLTLELTSAIAKGETVLLEYATKDTGIADAAGNVFGKDRRQVINQVSEENKAPTGHLSISMLLDGNTVTATRPLPEDQTTLSATPTVGDTLTAVTSEISDADGPETLSFSYQWQAGGDDIAAATAETFTLTNAQLGKQIKLIVHYTDDENRVETLASAQTNQVKEANTPPTANADDGVIMGASAVSSPSAAFSPSGASDDSIAQAQQETPAEPINQILTQSANEILLVFSGDATLDEVSGADFTVSGAASNPTVSSVGRFNDVTTLLLLTLSADIVESETITLAYTKGTGSITVTGQNTPLASFTNKAVTNLVEPDTRAPVAVSAETNTTGDSIVLTFNEAININDAVAADFTVTAGKRARTIAVTTLTANEKTLTLELTSAIAQGETVLLEYATKDTGIADAAGNVFGKDRRQVTNKVSVSNQPPTGHLSISMLLDGNTVTATRPLPEDQTTLSATPTVGDTLTAVTRGISDADGPETLSFSYQWQAGGDDIAAATAETFTLTNAQLGKQIKLIVRYTDTANRVETLASAQTNQVSNDPGLKARLKEVNTPPTANAGPDQIVEGGSAHQV